MMKQRRMEQRKRNNHYRSVVMALLMVCLPAGMLAQEKNDSVVHRDNNIKAYDYMIPKRRGADRFESKTGTEHLFFSAGAGMTWLFDMGSGHKAHGPKASFYVATG